MKRQIKQIVVRAPSWVGDAVMSLPALHELRRIFPDAQITLSAPPGAAEIFALTSAANTVLVETPTNLASILNRVGVWRRANFDLAVLFQNSFAAALVPFLARVPLRFSYATDHRRRLLTAALPAPEWKNERHESFYYLNIVSELERSVLGTSTVGTGPPRFDLQVSEEERRGAYGVLAEFGINAGHPLAALCPGSINSRAKRWPAERYAQLADRLSESGCQVVLIGSAAELPVSESVASIAKTKPAVLTGKTTVAEVVALISMADILITNDTGPAHIGAAVGTPTLVIFGPTNPLTTYPLSPSAEMIRHPPDCAPCMLRDCPIDHRCMTAISPDEVFARAAALLRQDHVQVAG